ncbi:MULTISPECIES: RNA polymerase sigma factor [Priestia]|uniref:RNA polymerase sigma factor n=1 Tax=Priestia TaxID=2800373 RepID=UPI001C8D6BDD|nr:sigma-70 family RNA polymerase sigma factor [Priestia aryabhattai]MBY0213576.1 sigma-70 family RNA polymerase sigma factor [Priestia aryabhattai]
MEEFEYEVTVNSLVEQYQTQLLHIASAYVKDSHAAEDIVQQVWIKYYQLLKLEGKDSKKSAYAWLYRVTVNQSIDFLRRVKNKRVISSNNIEMTQYSQNIDTILLEQHVIERLENEELLKRIDILPEKYQHVIVYFYFKDLPYNEIATALNISLGTVKARLHRAKYLLRKMYPEKGDN